MRQEVWRLTSDPNKDSFPLVEVVCFDDGSIVGPEYVTRTISRLVKERKKLPPAVVEAPVIVSRKDTKSLAVATTFAINQALGSKVWNDKENDWTWTGKDYEYEIENLPDVIY